MKINDFFPIIKYPPEIEFLDELNRNNRKEYEKWIYKSMIMKKREGHKSPENAIWCLRNNCPPSPLRENK